MKKCRRCGELKDYSEFNKHKRNADRHQAYCKQCQREYSKENYDKDASLKYTRRWKKNNPTFYSWNCMITRCYCESHSSYPQYGGKGVQVCDRWRGRGGYKNFYDDMGERPTISGVPYQIDRIDNNGNYTPENCRWVTQADNLARRVYK